MLFSSFCNFFFNDLNVVKPFSFCGLFYFWKLKEACWDPIWWVWRHGNACHRISRAKIANEEWKTYRSVVVVQYPLPACPHLWPLPSRNMTQISYDFNVTKTINCLFFWKTFVVDKAFSVNENRDYRRQSWRRIVFGRWSVFFVPLYLFNHSW